MIGIATFNPITTTINNQTRFDEKSSGPNNDQRDKHRGYSFIYRDKNNYHFVTGFNIKQISESEC